MSLNLTPVVSSAETVQSQLIKWDIQTLGGVGNLADIDRPTKSMYVFPLLINFRMCVWQKRKNIAMASGVKNRGMCLDSSTAADKHTSRWVFVRRLQHTKIHTKYVVLLIGAPSSQNCYPPIYVLQCIEETLPWSRSSPAKAQLLFHSSKSSLLISRCLALDRELSALCTPTTGLPYLHHACLTCYGWYLYWKYGYNTQWFSLLLFVYCTV